MKKRGRPKKAKDEKLSKRVIARLTEAEFAVLESMAADHDITVSDALRQLIPLSVKTKTRKDK